MVIGWMISWIRRFLLDVFLLVITTQLSLYCGHVEKTLAARNRKGNSDTVTKSPSTTRTLFADHDLRVLYANSQSEIHREESAQQEGIIEVDPAYFSSFIPLQSSKSNENNGYLSDSDVQRMFDIVYKKRRQLAEGTRVKVDFTRGVRSIMLSA